LAGSRTARALAGDRHDVVPMFDRSLAERRVAFSKALRNLTKYGSFPPAPAFRLLLCDRIGNSLTAVSLVQSDVTIFDVCLDQLKSVKSLSFSTNNLTKMLSRTRALLTPVLRTAAAPSCSACRSFSSTSPSLAPRSTPSSLSPAPTNEASSQSSIDQLMEIVEDVSANTPEAGPGQSSLSIFISHLYFIVNPITRNVDQSSVLQHLRRGQVISPQHLSPQHLLTPYLPRPNFSLAHPLGPPTSFGPTHDPFVRYGLDPLKDLSAMNPFWKAEFCTTMGKIKPRGKTGLQRKSQRRVGKSIRRARVSSSFAINREVGRKTD